MKFDPFAIARNAVANSSNRPVSDVEIGTALATGTGAGHVVRAIFDDCSLETLLTMADEVKLSRKRLVEAYQTAKQTHAAINEAFEQTSFDA